MDNRNKIYFLLSGRLISQIVSSLRRIKDVLLIISSHFGEEEFAVPKFPRIIDMRDKKEFDGMKLNFSIYNKGRLKKFHVTEIEL